MNGCIACTIRRGGTSRGVFVSLSDVPPAGAERERVLLALMGSPHPGQIDGLGGARPESSKVVLFGRSSHPDADVDAIFVQVGIHNRMVNERGLCGNLLAALGAHAVERGLATMDNGQAQVRVWVPRANAAKDLGLTATESHGELSVNKQLLGELEFLRAQAAVRLGLATSVAQATSKHPFVPFLCLCARPPRAQAIRARFYTAGVIHPSCPGAAGVCLGIAARLSGTVLACEASDDDVRTICIEHPEGRMIVDCTLDEEANPQTASVTRTQRKLLDGYAYVRSALGREALFHGAWAEQPPG